MAMADERLARSVPSGEEMVEIRRWVDVLTDGLDTIFVTHEEDQRTRKVRLQRLIQKCEDVFEKDMNPSHRPDELDPSTQDAVRVLWEQAGCLESTDIESLINPLREMEEIRRRVAVLMDGLNTIFVTYEEGKTVRLQDLIQKCEDVFEKYMNPSYEPIQAESAELDPSIQDAVRILLEHAECLESTDIESMTNSLR
ncbi:hypothetical protein MMC07_006619 [Pseudocyphellaria aurata]|nr:hypothetical protein [Pseudocyphellaria aurata]